MTSEFVHLHNHSDYSLLDGAQRVDQLVNTIDDLNMDSLALTEHGNMFSVVPFYKQAKNAGINPIIGCETYVAVGSRHDKKPATGGGWGNNHLILLVQNQTGYQNLMKLVTAGYLEGFYYRPRIDMALLEKYSDGLICLSGCLKGEIPEKMLNGDYEGAKNAALKFSEIFSDRFYLEVQNHGIPEEEANIINMKKLSEELSLPIVCTNDAHYSKREHSEAHDIHICLGTGKDRDDPNRLKYATPEFYFKTQDEMYKLFKDIPGAIENTRKIAESIDFKINTGSYHLPSFPIPEDGINSDPDEYLKTLVVSGAKNLYNDFTPDIDKQIDHELSVIKNMGFAGYFLITADFVQYAKTNGIPVGPGRGSAAGSLVSYALGITDIDPIKHNLLFERFLNPDRISMPDIDIDFCIERRGEVIDYIKKQYGERSVSQIITFGSMKAKQVIRDVGRVMGYTFSEVDRLAKAIPDELNITLDSAIKKSPEFRKMSENEFKELVDHSLVLEGMNRHASIHAAGVVIAPGDLTEFVPLYKSSSGDITTQYDMKGLEDLGLLKMDFLGLRNLTVINKALALINAKGKKVEIEKVSMDEPEVYKLFSNGLTIGVFQFESSGMREYLKKLKPTAIGDLIAMNALYRPGPMNNIDNFIARKHGKKKIEYPHPSLVPILEETYGIIVYQEQVMQIAHDIAGFTLSEADIMRRAMGKKDKKLMDELSIKFVAGAQKNDISKRKAEQIYALIEKFAQYGFNKSHATAYAYIAYQTAWLKTFYAAEFMAANLTSEMSSIDRIVTLINECKKLNIEVRSPDINVSFTQFYPIDKKTISYGLNAIKNVGEKALESIIENREQEGDFKTVFEFCSRIDQQKVNKRVLESLIKSGSMDSISGTRSQNFDAIDIAIKYGQQLQNSADKDQVNLFSNGSEEDSLIKAPTLRIVDEWEEKKSLGFEKEVLGLYVSGHPLLEHSEDLEEFTSVDFSDSLLLKKNEIITVGGMVTKITKKYDRRNRAMAFFEMDCIGGHVEVIAFSDCFAMYENLIEEDSVIFVNGKMADDTNFSDLKVMAEKIVSIENAREHFSRKLVISFKSQDIKPEDIEDLYEFARKYPGDCNLIFLLPNPNPDISKPISVLAHNIKVSTNKIFIKQLRDQYGKENIRVE
ncbi:MAG: DNA polymerase III subunit alpha [Candidatus Marinimicrobia bacterium]|nr:DNA polymerase III subunit alpha [Candidatus Neomarinimicrobiota bacterium]